MRSYSLDPLLGGSALNPDDQAQQNHYQAISDFHLDSLLARLSAFMRLILTIVFPEGEDTPIPFP